MLTVQWSHPAVLNGAVRETVAVIVPEGSTLSEHIARTFLPFGIEGLEYLTIHSIEEQRN